LFIKEKQKFRELKTQEIKNLEKEKEKFKDNLSILEGMKYKDNDILDLDIGGTHKITTTRATLTKVS